MAISNNKADRKLVDQFLRSSAGSTDQPAGSGFLSKMSDDITTKRGQRRAAQQVNRATGAGPFAGKSPFGGNAAAMGTNTGGAGGRAILQQGMGQVGATASRQPAIGPGRAPVPAISAPTPPPGAGGLAVPGGAPTQNIGQIASQPTRPPALNAGPTARPMPPRTALGPGSATRLAASQADDLIGTAGRAAASGADDVAGAAARQAGIYTRTATPTTITKTATELGKKTWMSGVGKGLGIAGAGYMASSFFDGFDVGGENSAVDRTGTGAILGAGLASGAAIALGLGTGPVGWAALGGAALLGGYQAKWGDDKTTAETMTKNITETGDIIESLAMQYGIEESGMNDIMLQYEASTAMYLQNDDKEGLKQFMAGMGTQLPALMLQARDQQKVEGAEQDRFNSMMQAQAQFAPIFEQSLERANTANQTAYQVGNETAAKLEDSSPNLAALFRQQAATSRASASNLQAAYGRQMAQTPVVTGTSDELQRQLAQEQLLNQQLASMG